MALFRSLALLVALSWASLAHGQTIDRLTPEITTEEYVAWYFGDPAPPADPPKPAPEPVEPLKIEGDYVLQIRKLPCDIVAPEGFAFYDWKPARELLTFEQGNRCTVEKADKAGTYRIQVTYYEQEIVDGKIKTTTHGGYLDVLIGQQPVTPPDPDDPVDPDDPPVDPNRRVTRLTYVFEKDQKNTPRPVALALQKINTSTNILATEFEEDTVNGSGNTPDQYKTALEAARKAGLPALVVQDAETVLRVVKDPTTEAAVMDAMKIPVAKKRAMSYGR